MTGTPLGEDALYEALVEAREMAEEPVRPIGKGESLIDDAVAYAEWQVRWQNWKRERHTSRALLEAARWFREHGYVDDGCGLHGKFCFTCVECEYSRPSHDPECTVGRWVRAADRAGL